MADRVLVLDTGRCIADTSAASLAETLGVRRQAALELDGATTVQAAEVLRTEGFRAQPNGRGVYVDVNPNSKAAPIHALTARGMTVRSFDIENAGTIARLSLGDSR